MNIPKVFNVLMFTFAAVAVLTTLKTGVSLLQARAEDAQQCTDATLTGAYVYEIIGQDGTQAPFLPFAASNSHFQKNRVLTPILEFKI